MDTQNKYGNFVPETNNTYSITKDSEVYSHRNGSVRKLKQWLSSDGYPRVGIYFNDNKEPTIKEVHQLMAIVYLNHIPNGLKIVVDHIDRDKSNNNLTNLRLLTNTENINNQDIDNIKGYHKVKDRKTIKYRARIRVNGKYIELGRYLTAKEAHQAYSIAYIKYHGHLIR